MKKILFSVLMFLSIPVFAGISSYFPYGLKASTITATGQSTLSNTTVNGTLSVSSTTEMQTAVIYSTMNVYGALRFGNYAITHPDIYAIDMTGVNTALKIGNMVWGAAYGNAAWTTTSGASIDLGNVVDNSQTFTTLNNITNATAGQLFVSRLAPSNTTADYMRLDSATDTKIWGVNIGKNLYAKYGLIVGSTLTVRGLTYTWPNAHAIGALTNDGAGNLSWTSASVPLTTATVAATPMVWTDTQTFTQGKVFMGSNKAFVPEIFYATPTAQTVSTFTITCNGVYQLDWSLTMGGSAGQIFINFDGASTGHYGIYYTVNSANAPASATTWDSRSVVYLNYGGNNVAANGPAEGSATINCLSASNTFVNATFMSNDSDGYWNGGWLKGLYTAGHPNAIYVKTTSPASGSVRLRKVSD